MAGVVVPKLGTLLVFGLLAVIAGVLPSLQNNASKLLLAIMESRHDSENAERILYNMRPKELVSPWVAPKLPTPFKPATAALGRLGRSRPPQACCKRSVRGLLGGGRAFQDLVK